MVSRLGGEIYLPTEGSERSMYLQSYVVAVCLFERVDGKAELRALEGTAFFIGNRGMFLTARHVIEAAASRVEGTTWEIGLSVKGDNGKSPEERVVPVTQYEFAPRPFDIAAGVAPYRPDTPLHFCQREVSVWQEVATMGYPVSASAKEGEALWMNLRGQRGHVQRTTLPRDMPIGDHPPGIELSFLIGPGMSGAPIFTVPDQIVIGVAVGSNRSEIIDDSVTEIYEDGREFREIRLRVEQNGFAHDIAGLFDWQPSFLNGDHLLKAGEAV